MKRWFVHSHCFLHPSICIVVFTKLYRRVLEEISYVWRKERIAVLLMFLVFFPEESSNEE
jgi:hypothetical protein